MMINMLHTLMRNSSTELLRVFELHYSFLPCEEKLETKEIDSVLESPRPENAPQVICRKWKRINRNLLK